MLNPQIISENIVFLRQRAGLTQQELAARANVTHQAVSKWENGSSIPDLQTLMTLSRLFGVTLDELLTEALAERRDAAPEAAAAPQPEPDEPKEAPAAREREPAVKLNDLIALAPFMPGARLGRLVMEQIDSVTPESLVPLAPFLGRQAMDEIAARMDFSDITPGRLIALAPFMSRAALDAAFRRMDAKAITSDQIAGLAPFLSRETLSAMVERMDPPAAPGQLAALAPFLDRGTLGDIVSRVGQLSMGALTALAPFLSRDTISAQLDKLRSREDDDAGPARQSAASGAGAQSRLALRLAEKGDFDALEDIFPRLDEDTRLKIVDMALDADETDFLDGQFSRLSADAQRRIALRRAENGDFDEIEDIFSMLDEDTQLKLLDMALDADETDFLENVNALRILPRRAGEEKRAEAAAQADEAGECAAAEKALLKARRGDFSAAPRLFDRMTSGQKDEIVRLAIVFDNTDFLIDCIEDIPSDSLETLCFSLARMNETERIAPFMARLRPETRARVERILAERD
ncbi:MAG: helix-turn-helix transcriptional regulator [Clostridia bacterium]|nr:helix-turn-helix transcriptional regulator [Clostridia bacterium]